MQIAAKNKQNYKKSNKDWTRPENLSHICICVYLDASHWTVGCVPTCFWVSPNLFNLLLNSFFLKYIFGYSATRTVHNSITKCTKVKSGYNVTFYLWHIKPCTASQQINKELCPGTCSPSGTWKNFHPFENSKIFSNISRLFSMILRVIRTSKLMLNLNVRQKIYMLHLLLC